MVYFIVSPQKESANVYFKGVPAKAPPTSSTRLFHFADSAKANAYSNQAPSRAIAICSPVASKSRPGFRSCRDTSSR
jgi:hypothetical protein